MRSIGNGLPASSAKAAILFVAAIQSKFGVERVELTEDQRNKFLSELCRWTPTEDQERAFWEGYGETVETKTAE